MTPKGSRTASAIDAGKDLARAQMMAPGDLADGLAPAEPVFC
jgi:hypothetical protein